MERIQTRKTQKTRKCGGGGDTGQGKDKFKRLAQSGKNNITNFAHETETQKAVGEILHRRTVPGKRMESRRGFGSVGDGPKGNVSFSDDVFGFRARCFGESVSRTARRTVWHIQDASRVVETQLNCPSVQNDGPATVVTTRSGLGPCTEGNVDHRKRPVGIVPIDSGTDENISDLSCDSRVFSLCSMRRSSERRKCVFLTGSDSSGKLGSTQDSNTDWSQEDSSSNSVALGQENIYPSREKFLPTQRTDHDVVEAQQDQLALNATRRVKLVQAPAYHGRDFASVDAHIGEEPAQLSGRNPAVVSRQVRLPLLQLGMSDYELSCLQWLRRLGIGSKMLGPKDKHFVELSAGDISLGSLGMLHTLQTGQIEGTGDVQSGMDHRLPQSAKVDGGTHLVDIRSTPSTETLEYPLYTPKMKPLDLNKILSWATPEERNIIQWTSNVSLYQKVLRDVPKARRRLYEISKKVDVEKLVEAGIAVRADKWEWKSSVRVFAIPEGKKRRRRLILDSRLLNESIDLDIFGLRTKFIKFFALGNMVLQAENSSVIAADFQCWYYQIPLSPEVRKYFAFVANGQLYYVARLPMGFSAAVAIGNTISRIVLRRTLLLSAAKQIKQYEGFIVACWENGRTIAATTQVDNSFIFTGDKAILNHFEDVCREAHVIIGELEIFSEGDILGMHFMFKEEKVRLTDKFVSKHINFLKSMEQTIPAWVYWRATAIVLRGLSILGMKYCFFYAMMFFIRRVATKIFAGTIHWCEEITIEDLAWRQLQEACRLLYHNTPTPIQRVCADGHVIFSDASELQGGVVVVGPKHQFVVEVQVTGTHIGEKEASALKSAVHIAKKLRLKCPTFVVDATVLVFACAKGHSKNFHVNSAVSSLRTWFPSALTFWVGSADNPADEPSRRKEPDWEKIHRLETMTNERIEKLQIQSGMPVYRSTPVVKE